MNEGRDGFTRARWSWTRLKRRKRRKRFETRRTELATIGSETFSANRRRSSSSLSLLSLSLLLSPSLLSSSTSIWHEAPRRWHAPETKTKDGRIEISTSRGGRRRPLTRYHCLFFVAFFFSIYSLGWSLVIPIFSFFFVLVFVSLLLAFHFLLNHAHFFCFYISHQLVHVRLVLCCESATFFRSRSHYHCFCSFLLLFDPLSVFSDCLSSFVFCHCTSF